MSLRHVKPVLKDAGGSALSNVSVGLGKMRPEYLITGDLEKSGFG